MSDEAQPRAEPLLIDEARVAILRRDPAEWSEIVTMYREYTGELLDALERDLAEGNRTGVARHVHQLKGCSANMGMLAVTALCEDLEKRAGAEAPFSPARTTARLRDLIARSVSALG